MNVAHIGRLLFGLAFALNAGVMVAAPRWWCETLPGVAERGAFNGHFVRDIGCGFLVAGAAFVLSAFRPAFWRSAMIAATAFIALHALVHLAEAVAHPRHREFILADFLTVYLPAALAVVLVLAPIRKFQP